MWPRKHLDEMLPGSFTWHENGVEFLTIVCRRCAWRATFAYGAPLEAILAEAQEHQARLHAG